MMPELMHERPRRTGGLRASLAGAACLGPWSCEPATGRFALTAALATRLDLVPGVRSVALDALLGSIHPVDRIRIESVLHAALGTSSMFEAEFRSGSRSRPVWLRLMGRAEADREHRTTILRGLAFDLTENRLRPGPPAERAHRQANQLADLVVAMQGIVAGLHNPSVAEPFEQLKKAVGVEIARHLRLAHGRHTH